MGGLEPGVMKTRFQMPPTAISTALWPYALRYVNDVYNITPHISGLHEGKTPMELFAGVEVVPNLKDYHPFGCPVYCLNNKLQAGKSINKWLPRARLGIYLGFSPNHARNVGLVLNHKTGLVSPQFHVKHDDLWETVGYHRNKMEDMSAWKGKAFPDRNMNPMSSEGAKEAEPTSSEGAGAAEPTSSEGAEEEVDEEDDPFEPGHDHDEVSVETVEDDDELLHEGIVEEEEPTV
eukprot:CAMPEP_0113628660 /NCGR_PEP_ID=MMETSP0017_2-20120614/14853_1 /TAXON_ID=2856 /ORGANISM="Cylindrotheca closterium" /LENGTH=233 /DNA_ID=CAMNT_0000538979 /DNA_START=376 /DNA_END=1074 /DNA_ORIENTATION=- /assembly_acc=CAM_ASM_000147